jgi:hypothetical protein
MSKLSTSDKIFVGIILILISIKLFDIIVSPNHIYPGRVASFSWVEIGLVAIFGFMGLKLSEITGFPAMWDQEISNKQRFLYPVIVGLLFGLIFMLFDSQASIGDMSVGFPLSILFYLFGGIFSEIVLHIFPVTFLIWLISNVVLKKKIQNQVFWVAAIGISLFDAISMIMAFNNPNIPLQISSTFLMIVLAFLIFINELVTLYFFRIYGFLSPIVLRLSFYLMWHIIWPVLFY